MGLFDPIGSGSNQSRVTPHEFQAKVRPHIYGGLHGSAYEKERKMGEVDAVLETVMHDPEKKYGHQVGIRKDEIPTVISSLKANQHHLGLHDDELAHIQKQLEDRL